MSKKRISDKAGWVDPRNLPRGPNGRALCRFCFLEVPRGRRTFCSDLCVHHHKLRTRPAYVRSCLAKRDKGVCTKCGFDTQAEARSLMEARKGLRGEAFRRWLKEFRRQLGADPGSRNYYRYWDADHINPVAEGGGECGLNNYQTLCLHCHKAKTAEQKKKAAAVKRAQPVQENSSMSNEEKPDAKLMQMRLKQWMSDDDNKPHRLVSATKLNEIAKVMDPEIRGGKGIQTAVVREVALMIKKAMLRCYDNKRATLRPLDL